MRHRTPWKPRQQNSSAVVYAASLVPARQPTRAAAKTAPVHSAPLSLQRGGPAEGSQALPAAR